MEIFDPIQNRIVGYLDMEHLWAPEPIAANPDSSFQYQSTNDTHSFRSHLAPPHRTQAVLLDGSRFGDIKCKHVSYKELANISLAPGVVPLRNFIAAWKVIIEHQYRYGLFYHRRFWFTLVFLRLLVGSELWESKKAHLINKARAATNTRKISLEDVERTAQLLGAKYDEETEVLRTLRPVHEIASLLILQYMHIIYEEEHRAPRTRGEPEAETDRPMKEPVEEWVEWARERRQKQNEAEYREELALQGIFPSEIAATDDPGESTFRCSVRLCEPDTFPQSRLSTRLPP